MRTSIIATLLTVLLTTGTTSSIADDDIVHAATVTVLSSNLANGATTGEWGFSAMVQTADHCTLFDAGRFTDTVVNNATALQVDLGCVRNIVLSHFHFDHTSGLASVVARIRTSGYADKLDVYVGEGFFIPRIIDMNHPAGAMGVKVFGASSVNFMQEKRAQLEALGLVFHEISQPTQITQGVWATGPVPRVYPEQNHPSWVLLQKPNGETTPDTVPESQGLVVRTQQGPIVLLGCGHSGAVNMLSLVRQKIQDKDINALMGGMHLFNADQQTVRWTGVKLKELGLKHLMAGHCTGVEPMFQLRQALGLNRSQAVMGAVGASFSLAKGVMATDIAK
jgi:7,8-dihydropterin-6-yl-methyl-4-(beta-D-ribofuranosyl)aminobenzene 5'-phosphate synthase